MSTRRRNVAIGSAAFAGLIVVRWLIRRGGKRYGGLDSKFATPSFPPPLFLLSPTYPAAFSSWPDWKVRVLARPWPSNLSSCLPFLPILLSA